MHDHSKAHNSPDPQPEGDGGVLKLFSQSLLSSLPSLVTGKFICCCTSAQMPGIEPRGDKNVFRR